MKFPVIELGIFKSPIFRFIFFCLPQSLVTPPILIRYHTYVNTNLFQLIFLLTVRPECIGWMMGYTVAAPHGYAMAAPAPGPVHVALSLCGHRQRTGHDPGDLWTDPSFHTITNLFWQLNN